MDVPNVCSITMQDVSSSKSAASTYIQEPPARLPQGILQMVKCDCRNCPSEICNKVLEPEKEIYWRMKQHHCYKKETPDHTHTHTHKKAGEESLCVRLLLIHRSTEMDQGKTLHQEEKKRNKNERKARRC
jgi:hypothetical protein